MVPEPDPDPARRSIPDPGFAGDHGSAPAELAAALAAYASDPERHLDVFLALQRSRLLVPVVAVPEQAGADRAAPDRSPTSGLPASSGVEMATALLTGQDGRQALLAFTCLATLAAWRRDARPVPVAASEAAQSALQEGAAALLVDVAGPTTYAVEGRLLEALAHGWTLAVTPEGPVWVETPAQE